MPPWAPEFIAALAKSPNVAAAARVAGIGRRTAYDAREIHPEFAALWDDAIEAATDNLAAEAYRRAYEGADKPVYHQGHKVGTVKEYSDTLAIFLLKSHRREVYGDRQEIHHSGKMETVVRKQSGVSQDDL